MLLLINNVHKNVRDSCSFKFSWLCYITLYNANSLKIPLSYVFLLVLFKVNAFPFKNKDKSHIFHAKVTFTLCSAAPCLFCFEAICDRYFFKLNCFKMTGRFNHHNVFPPIRSVCYRFLHCDYRKLQCDYKKLYCDYRKLHCCLGLTALKSINHSRVISLCILLV
jgi:hypothetical protein